MGLLDRVKGRNPTTENQVDSKNDVDESLRGVSDVDSDTLSLEARDEKEVQQNPNQVTADAASGVKKAEATALVWSQTAVYLTYAWIWVCFFVLALQSSIAFNCLYYAYSSFATAPAIATANILASIIGGVIKLPIAKTLNLWGRAEGLAVSVVVYVVGIIICAACTGPNGYAAGYVIFYVGYSALYLILDVFVADTSGLKNRAFAFAFVGTPFICTAFTGPLAAQAFIGTSPTTGWRWAFGAFAIIMPVIFAPLMIVFKMYQKKAEKMGLYVRPKSGRTTMQSIIHYVHEFDVIGALILIAAFILFLLPFSLASYGRATYRSATFIVMVIIGFCLFFVFAAWERFFARTHFVRWELFKQRTVIGACLLAAILFFSFYSWDQNYYNFIIVVYDLSISKTGYVTQVYNVGSTAWGVIFGIYIRATKRFKYACLFFGLPLMFLGAGLLIHFRGQDADLGYVIMCQVFIAVAGGTLVIGEDMAVMSAADRDGVPMMLSLISLFSSIGGAIGSAVAVSIYAGTFPQALASRLPADQKALANTIYLGGYTAQIKYATGTQTRAAINYAWGESQKYGAISATVVLVLAIPCIAVWKNYRTDRQQNKGTMI